MIDWTDYKAPISANFVVGEALYLPSWKVWHAPSEAEKANILAQAEKLELVRAELGQPINVLCWIRPISVSCVGPFQGKNYNRLVGGAENSAHIVGSATDFTVSGITCDEVRHLLESKLVDFGIRMEKKPGAQWVHIDSRELLPNGKRYFTP